MSRSRNVPRGTSGESGESDELVGLEQVLAELGDLSGHLVHVFKAETADSKLGFGMKGLARCGVYPADDFELDRVRDDYGPGRYRIQVKNSRHRIVKTQAVQIAPTLAQLEAERNGETPSSGDSGNPVQSAMLDVLMKREEQASSMMQAVMVGLVSALGNNNGGGMNAEALIAAFREGRESSNPPAPPHEQIKDIFSMGIDVATTAMEAGGGNGAGDGSFLERYAPKLLGILEKAQTQALPAATTPATHSATDPSPQAANATQGAAQAPEPADPVAAFIKAWVGDLIVEAKAGRDPWIWGQYLAERVNPAGRELLHNLAMANRETRQQAFGQFAPELIPYAEFAHDVLDAALEMYEPQIEQPAAPQAVPDPPPAGTGDGDAVEDNVPAAG